MGKSAGKNISAKKVTKKYKLHYRSVSATGRPIKNISGPAHGITDVP
jgi:hypothetical protein